MLAQGEITKASRQLEMVIRRVPDNGRYRLPYAEALIREGRTNEALEQTEISLQGHPRRTQAMIRIPRARAYLKYHPLQVKTVLSWTRLMFGSQAQRSLDEADATGIEVPNSAMINRQLGRRRTTLQEKCPVLQEGD